MAHTKSGGSTALGRDSASKRLGVKIGDGAPVRTGMIIVRQRGTSVRGGINVARGADDTLYSLADGLIRFRTKKTRRFHGQLLAKTIVDVVPTPADSH
ncbi:MAG: 50S ribosomal protein L27 [Candidatus Kerfeldbacteria bacterium]|nr:50S ribosomal protein L27 [Candidatus Kerfeldbacteria bacterium]